MSRKVLLIEDNADIAQLVALHLATIDCTVETVADGRAGLTRAESGAHDLLVLDLMLPGIDGLDICRRLRAKDSRLPILMLTARTGELDRVLGLELGADDYLGKPFSVLELVARVKSLLRRSAPPPAAPRIELGPLAIDIEARRVRLDGRSIELTAKEFDLLVHFARSPGRVMTRMQLLEQVWGYGHAGYEHTVNTHINRLRNKIEPDAERPTIIETVWGVGYRCREAHELARPQQHEA